MAASEARVPLLADSGAKHEAAAAAERAAAHASLSRSVHVVTSLVAGACAGALAKSTIAPLDRTKINFQASHTPYSWRAALHFLSCTVSREGVGALWRGNSATMARIVPYAAVQFTAHEQCKRALHVDTPQRARKHRFKHFLAGSMAGVISQSVTYPLDMARARMAVTNSTEYASLWAVFRNVTKFEGILALYRGYTATILGVIPYAGVSFFMYENFKHKYLEYFDATQGALTNVAFGGCAGALAQTTSYPLDIVRRRMQTVRPGADGTYLYSSIPRTLQIVYAKEGVRGFFKGLSMNWVKGPIAVGISFASYDAIRTSLRDLAHSLN